MVDLVFGNTQLVYLPTNFHGDAELTQEVFAMIGNIGGSDDLIISDDDDMQTQMAYAGAYYTRMWIMGHGGTKSDCIANTAGDQRYTAQELAEELDDAGLSPNIPELLVWSCYGGKIAGFAAQLRAALVALNPAYSAISVLGFPGITGGVQPGGQVTYLDNAGASFSSGDRLEFRKTMQVEQLFRNPPLRRARRNSFG